MQRDLYSFARKQGLNEKKVVDSSSGISPLGPSRKVRAAIRKAIKDLNIYPDPSLLRLRRFFVSRFGLAEEGLFFASSMEELVYLLPTVFRPTRVLVVGPSLNLYEDASTAAGAVVTYLISGESSGFDIDVTTIRQNLDGIDLLFIANPNRLTGRLTDRKELYQTLKHAADKKVLVVLDESLIEFTKDCDYYIGDNIVVLRTTAHFYGLPGLELAYAVGSASVINDLGKAMNGNVTMLAAEAARVSLMDKTYQKLVRNFVADEKRHLMRALKKIKGLICYESDSNMVLIRLEYHEEELLNSLARAGFFIRDCAEIRGLDSSFLRLSIMDRDKIKKFLRIVNDTYV